MSARLLMIALDGADGALLDQFSKNDRLSNLAMLRSRGCARRLSEPPGITDDALWASFQYAVRSGEHGRYHYRLPFGAGRVRFAPMGERGRDAFWDGLSSRGLRVAVFDVPKCRLPRRINGIHLADWLVHGRYFSYPLSYPEELAAEVVGDFGPAPPSRCGYQQSALSDEDVREITGDLCTAVSQKRAAGLRYLGAESWDLFIIGFKELHCCCHSFWDFTDVGHPEHDPARVSRLGNPVMTILRDIDQAIGDLVAAAGHEAEIIVFSPTDMQPNGSLDHLMTEIVTRLNKHLEERARSRIEHAPDRLQEHLASGPDDWQCEVLPYAENAGALRISVRSGSTIGTVAAAADRARVIDEIESMLGELTDVETGAGIVSSITRPSTEFHGARAALLPDLLIHYRSGAFPRAVSSPRLGRIDGISPRMRPGNHLAGGLIIAAGKVVPAAISEVNSITDIGPLAEKVLR